MVPSAFGRYQIIEEIGRGGMARVYRALDPRFERDVAVKVLPSEVMDEAMFRARFEREAKVIAALEHPAIVAVYDFGDQDGQPYLVMRYMPGGSLRERLTDGKMPPEEASALVRRMASALDYAHDRGIIHRDLKPGNILFDGRGDPYLTDFGIVKMAQSSATLTGEAIIGTPAYMSPEQAQGDTTIDHRTDVYSLGVILFEMLTGNQPYSADTPISLALKHIREPIPRLADFSADLPPGMQDIVDQAMAKSPVDRFGSAARMAKALEALGASHETRLGSAPVVAPAEDAPESESEAIVQEEVETESETSVGGPPMVPAPGDTGLGATLQPVEPSAGETVVAGDEVEIEPPKPAVEPVAMGEQAPGFHLPRMAWYGGGAVALVALAIGGFFAFRGASPAMADSTPTAAVPVVQATSISERPTEPSPAPWPEVAGEPPDENVGAFYYPWYGNPDVDGEWIHWQENGQQPPDNLASDYFPLLGPYSSMDPSVVAQHFAWLREAGVGVVITSWWGPGDRTDQAVPMLLEIADHYGLKVAFHIEPSDDRSADNLIDRISYIIDQYGGSPAFFRTSEPSRWISNPEPKGLFFLFDPYHQPGNDGEPVPEYWTGALDSIHDANLGVVLASTPDIQWSQEGHFDGLYNYAYVGPDPGNPDVFAWGRELPGGAWYVPSVLPGYSAKRIGYPADAFVPRNDGATYDAQWDSALNQGVRPNMVTITSFNEWHEGTSIEPASVDKPGGPDAYADFGAVGPLGYLEQTRAWVERFRGMDFAPRYRVQVHLVTTSDWTDFRLLSGGKWRGGTLLAGDDSPGEHDVGDNFINVTQPLSRANAGGQVERLFELTLTGVDPQGELRFAIERGHLGSTTVELFRMQGDEPVLVQRMRWAGIIEGSSNRKLFDVPAGDIVGP
ncbi:MAG: protein kinase [Anaerolineales bacterium]|jgi:tRNA A-37 threonylcarbamoyl transferase component Bud32